MESILKSLITTLSKVEVCGKDNLDMLLGCIQTLEKLLDVCEKAKTETEVKPNEADNQQRE